MKAFTLLEVLVSVMILLLASAVFFSLTSNSVHLFNLFEKRKYFELKATVPLTEEKGGNLKEILVNFKIRNDKILKALNQKIEFEKRVDLKQDFNDTNVMIYRLNAYDKTNSLKIYSLGIK